MSKTCNNCGTNEEKKPSSVPYHYYEDFKKEAKSNSLKWFITVIILIVLLVGSNIAWLIYESQFEYVEETYQEVVQEADNGENHFIGGDFVGETDDKDQNS